MVLLVPLLEATVRMLVAVINPLRRLTLLTVEAAVTESRDLVLVVTSLSTTAPAAATPATDTFPTLLSWVELEVPQPVETQANGPLATLVELPVTTRAYSP
jgi:hypothetical protein